MRKTAVLLTVLGLGLNKLEDLGGNYVLAGAGTSV